eukprot:2053000-Alexandrium_andersonii.AAC.1
MVLYSYAYVFLARLFEDVPDRRIRRCVPRRFPQTRGQAVIAMRDLHERWRHLLARAEEI